MALPLLLGAGALLGIGAAEVAAVAVSTVVVGGVTYYTYNSYTKSQAEKDAAKHNKMVTDCVDGALSQLRAQLATQVGGHMDERIAHAIKANNENNAALFEQVSDRVDARISTAIQANNAVLIARFDGAFKETNARMDRMDAGLAQILARLPQAPAVAPASVAPVAVAA